MKEKWVFLIALIVILLSAASGVVFWRYSRVLEQNALLNEKLDLALKELDSARSRDQVTPELDRLPVPDWEKMRTRARPDPRSLVLENLLAREDLIPWEGIHGGTMKIYDPSLVWFIGPRWCIAWVEDGHIGGYMLLRFDTDTGQTQWRLLDSEFAD
jgi:hypothetical protein